MQRWAAELPGAPDTVRKMVNVLSGALQLAVDDGRITVNPAVRLKLPLRSRLPIRAIASRSAHWPSPWTIAQVVENWAMGSS